VESIRAIDTFLARVGRRLWRRQIAAVSLWTAGVLAAGAVLIPMLAARFPGLAGQLGGIALLGATTIVIGAMWAVLAARRRWSRPSSVARFVGAREQSLASDLLTSVELAAGQAHPEFSRDLLVAHHGVLAARVSSLDPRQLAPANALLRPLAAAGVAAALVATAALAAPEALRRGLQALAGGTEAAFDGAALRGGPVVGDVEIELEPPAYTGRPKVILPAAAGDFRAMPGTVATIRTRALDRVVRARLVFGDDGKAADPIPLSIEDKPGGAELRGQMLVSEAITYRFLVESPGGARQVEADGHAIEIEADRAPQVELHTPADELDVSNRKRVELAYIATDDFGVTKVELVWTLGGETHRLPLPLTEPGRRSAQSKYLWDLSEIELPGGSQVPYHVEVSDNDDIGGPNVGRSRTYTLRVFSPRERHDQLIARQRELFEKVIALLGGRLPAAAEDLELHRQLNRATAQLVVDIGTVASALGEDKLADPELGKVLAALRERHDRFSRRERKLLDRIAARRRGGTSSERLERELVALDREQITALEDDTLALADWIDRQDMEGMLHIADEIKNHKERLAKLLAEHRRTGSPEVAAEIERELKALERLLAEQAERGRGMREDVLDQFVNADALAAQREVSCLAEVRALTQRGDAVAAAEKMEKCAAELDQSAEALEQALARMRGERFSEEQKELEELLGEMAGLAHDEDELAGAIDQIYRDYAEKASQELRAQLDESRRNLDKMLEAVRKRIAEAPEAGLTPFATEELEGVKARLDDLGEMLADGDLAEALAMSRQAEAGLEGAVAELAADVDDGEPWNDKTPRALAELEAAGKLAARMTDALRKATPSPDAVLGPAERRKLERLTRRQERLRQRASALAKRAGGASKLPRMMGEAVAGKLEGAGKKMSGVEGRLRARDPAGARHAAHEAADTLREMVRETQRQARGAMAGRVGHRDEPVRIPGAEEYRAPRELREDILEAMKKQGPAGYREMIERYYEELIK
jgi:hypothetical protein